MENNKVEFDYVKRKDGTSYFKEFMDSLPVKDKAKMLSTITKTQEHGLLVAQKMEWVKKLDTDIYELRSKVGSNIQRALYFQKVGNEYLITHGFTKKTQKTPKTEIERAKSIKDRYKEGELL